MKLGFLKWPFDGVNVSTNYSVYNIQLIKTNQPSNNFFSHPIKKIVFSHSILELWLRRTPHQVKQIEIGWYDFNNWNPDCDAIVIPYNWFLYFTKEQFILLSKFTGKIILDEPCDPLVFDEINGREDFLPNFFKEIEQLVNFENLYLLTSSYLDINAKQHFKNKFNNVKIISSNFLMLLLSSTTLKNKKRIYTDEYIIKNFNTPKDKEFLFCAGRPRQHRLALIKFLTDNNLIDNSFVSTNFAPDVKDSIADFVSKYKENLLNGAVKYQLNEFCDIKELLNYTDTKVINEYVEEYFRQINHYPKSNVYSNTKYSIISETVFQTHIDEHCWTSEKTCLPFVYGHPFLLFAMANTWKYLKSLGYNEYTQFGAYDSITAPYTRFKALCDSIYQLQEESMRKETLDVILHNTNNFYSKNLQDSIVSGFVNQLN